MTRMYLYVPHSRRTSFIAYTTRSRSSRSSLFRSRSIQVRLRSILWHVVHTSFATMSLSSSGVFQSTAMPGGLASPRPNPSREPLSGGWFIAFDASRNAILLRMCCTSTICYGTLPATLRLSYACSSVLIKCLGKHKTILTALQLSQTISPAELRCC